MYNIFVIFNEKYLTNEVIESLNKLKDSIINRELGSLKIRLDVDDNLDDLDFYDEETFWPEETKVNIKNESQFALYFKDLINNFKMKNRDSKGGFIKNEFYCLDLFEIIARRLYLAPIWSGIIISNHLKSLKIYKTIGRLSNNCVEGYFNILRNNILTISKRQKMKKKLCRQSFAACYLIILTINLLITITIKLN